MNIGDILIACSNRGGAAGELRSGFVSVKIDREDEDNEEKTLIILRELPSIQIDQR